MRTAEQRRTPSTITFSKRVAAVVLAGQRVCTGKEHTFLAERFNGHESWGSVCLEPEPLNAETLVLRASDRGATNDASRPVKLVLPHDVDASFAAQCANVARETLVQLYRWDNSEHTELVAL